MTGQIEHSSKKISLVVTVYNEENSIDRFLDSVWTQTRHPDELIIVDGGSTDQTVAKIKSSAMKSCLFPYRVIIDPSCSKNFSAGPIARGRNVAIANATFEIIACTDAGCILDTFWLEEIIKPFQTIACHAVAGSYRTEEVTYFQRLFAKTLVPNHTDVMSPKFLPSSRSIAFRKSVWEKVGGYPEDSYTAEDTAFDLKIIRSGFRFNPAPKAVVIWNSPRTFSESIRRHYSYGFGEGVLRLQLWKFMLRCVLLLVPAHIILNRKKMQAPWLPYILLFAHQCGYASGLLHKKNVRLKESLETDLSYKNIVFFSGRSAPFRGGVETHLSKLCRELLLSNQVKNILVVSNTPSKQEGLAYAKKSGYELYFVHDHCSMMRKTFGGASFSLLRKTITADIAHYHDFGSVLGYGLFTFIIRKILRRRVFITFHGWEGVFPPKKHVKIFRKILSKLSNRTIQVGSFIAKWYETVSDETIIGGVDLQNRPEISENISSIPNDCFFVGRIDTDTGAHEVLNAWANIVRKSKNSNSRLIFYGDGPLRPQLEKQIRNDALASSRTIFYGFVEEPLRLIPEGSIVFTSGYLSILESFSRYARVIAYYDHELKKDYLESIPGYKDMMWCARSIQELFEFYFEACSDFKKNIAGAAFARTNSWTSVKDVYLRLWRSTI